MQERGQTRNSAIFIRRGGNAWGPGGRPLKATLRAQDEHGEYFEQEAEGYAARAFLHETDHRNGKLFIDHLPKLRRDMVVKKFKKEKSWK